MSRGNDDRYTAEGRCRDCKQVRDDVCGGSPRCQPCRSVFNAYRRLRYEARKRLGVCANCGKAPAWRDDEAGRQRVFCEHCLAKNRRWQERWRLAARA